MLPEDSQWCRDGADLTQCRPRRSPGGSKGQCRQSEGFNTEVALRPGCTGAGLGSAC